MTFNVCVTRPIPQAGLDLLADQCRTLEVLPADPTPTQDDLYRAVRGRDGVLCCVGQNIDRAVLAAAGPQCRVFANYGVGVDHIDLAAAAELGITVTNTPGVLTDATADLTWALLLAAARRVVEGDRLARSGRWTGWDPLQLHGLAVAGTTLGIIGAGRIGTAVGRRSTGFRMEILYVDGHPNADLEAIGGRRVDLPTCLARADFVTLHTSLSDDTRHLIGAEELKLMKPTAVLINTSRGPVVDEKALAAALRDGRIAAAGLDVYEHEPHISPELAGLDNVVCLPHLGSATSTARAEMAELAAENLLSVLGGHPPANPVCIANML
ncbi:MAG: D-glycerate dehydrogenase [Planctomycetes bacterium]|nr:D-glycerate dehydrogenase [Planctomycetota bacterium]